MRFNDANMVPVAPLAAEVRRWAALHPPIGDHSQGGQSLLARLYADAHGIKVQTASRYVSKVALCEQERIGIDFADKLCLTMGTHPALVYGSLWNVEEVA